MGFVTTNDGVKVSYRSFGEGPRAVFLIHGWMVSGAVHNDLIELLDLSGLRVIVPDLRGAGESDKPEDGYTIERYADDIIAIADAEKIGSFVAFGHSMGGQIAQWLAAYHPGRIAGVVLGCPVPASGLAMPDDAIGLFSGAGGNREAQRIILGLACKELSDAARERVLDDAANTSPAAVRISFDTWRKGGFADAISQIRAPVLCIATDDPFLPPAFLRAEIVSKIEGARLAVLPGPGHYLNVERPRETVALLEAFLAALPR
jgi:non-heme chloroperoxidase